MTKRTVKRQEQRRELRRRKQLILAGALGLAALVAVALLAYFAMLEDESAGVTVEVLPAELSVEGQLGEALFKVNCQACHGPNAAGTKLGPPLIHDIYNPGHHSDEAFYLAAATGVRQHHWPYGDMPAQPQVTREDVTLIIRFVRELQEANGIVRKAY